MEWVNYGETTAHYGMPPGELANFTNSTETDLEERERFYKCLSVFVIAFHSLIVATGVIGNALVIYIILAKKGMGTQYNLMLLSLAFSDMLFVAICAPMTAYDFAARFWKLGVAICKIYQLLRYATFGVTVSTLALISIVRYISVSLPLKSRYILTRRTLGIALCLIWLVCFLLSAIAANVYTVVTWLENGHVTRSGCRFRASAEKNFLTTVLMVLFYFFLPMLLISLVSMATYVKVQHARKSRTVCSGAATEKRSLARSATDRETARIIVGITLAFIVSYFPFYLFYLLDVFPGVHFEYKTYNLLITVVRCMLYLNSCINPILYGFTSQRFRTESKKIYNSFLMRK